MQTGTSGDGVGKLLEPGDMFGDYAVEKLLGKGGMGAVYLVRAPGGERYAVKVMSPEMVKKGSDYRKRFAREAEFAMTIRHKNLISVYDVGEDPETGLCYIIMDYVPGGSVADRLEQGGPLSMAEAVSIAAQVALALEVAHRHGVIHRDIKPENIMFDADGTPKLADLGVAKFTDDEHKTTVTTTGMIIGTPAYMAPEQMMDSHHIDARADIYALGVVLYEMLTGKRPNEGSTAVELLAKAIKGEPLPDVRTMRPEISAAIAHVLSLMCAPKPEARPATALEAAYLLQKAATGRLVLPKKPPRAADAAARKKKRGMPWALLAVCAVVCALGAAVVASLLNKPPPQVLRQPVVITNVTERTVVLTNTVERVAIVTNLVGNAPMYPANGPLLQVAEKNQGGASPAESDPIVPYVSKSKLHALYRSKNRSHIFLGTGHALDGDGFATPPYSLARIKEMISEGAEIIHFHVSCSKDGILFSSKRYHLENVSNGTGNARDYTAQDLKKMKVKWRENLSSEGFATCEEIISAGKGKVLFNISGAEDYAREIEDLLNRLDAWESVILEGGDVAVFRQKYGRNIWRKFQTGEAQVMVGDAYLDDWRKVTPECMVWGRDYDLSAKGLTNIPERITCMFFDKPGPGLRTDDETGWQKAISEGVTVLRTAKPRELLKYLRKQKDRTARAELPVVPFSSQTSMPVKESLWDEDSTRAVQKALDALFPGWKTSENESRQSRPKGAAPVGFMPSFNGRNNVVCTLPYEKGDKPVSICWDGVLAQDAKLDIAVCNAPSSKNITGFLLQVFVNESIVHEEKVEDGRWRDMSIGLAKWARKRVSVEIRHSLMPFSPWGRAYWARITLTGGTTSTNDVPASSDVRRQAVVLFPSAAPDSTKWKARSPWRYEAHYPTPIGGREWTEPAFRDNNWKRTNKPLGACNSKALMRIADRWPHISPNLYLRRRFNWKGGRVAKVELTLFHACNVKFYLNGTLVLDKSGRNDDWEKIDLPADVFAKALRDGENVLAVKAEARQNPEMRYFDCGLTVAVDEEK